MKTRFLLSTALLILTAHFACSDNIIVNGDFEDGLKGWRFPTWRKDFIKPELDTREMPGAGTASLRLTGQKGKYCTAIQDFTPTAEKYRVSFKMKTAGMENWDYSGVWIYVDGMSKTAWTKYRSCEPEAGGVHTDWTEYRGEFSIPSEILKAKQKGQIYIQLKQNSPGTAWFDNLVLEPVSMTPASEKDSAAPQEALNLKKKRMSSLPARACDFNMLGRQWQKMGWIRNAEMPEQLTESSLKAEIPAGRTIALYQRVHSTMTDCDGSFRFSGWVKVSPRRIPRLFLTAYPLDNRQKDRSFACKAMENQNGWTRYCCDFSFQGTRELRPTITLEGDASQAGELEIRDLALTPLVRPTEEIILQQAWPGGCQGLFTEKEIPSAEYCFRSSHPIEKKLPLAITVTDYFGRKVLEYSQTLPLRPLEITRLPLRFPSIRKPGFYAVSVKWEINQKITDRQTAFVITRPFLATPDPMFGITFYAGVADNEQALRHLGAGTKGVRIVWHYIEQADGSYDWSATDRDVEACLRNGITVIGGFEPYIDRVPAKYEKRMKERLANKQYPFDQIYYDAAAKFEEAAARRYRGKVRHWAIISEIDLMRNRGPYPYPHYIERVKNCCRAVKKGNPEATVVGIGCSGGDGRNFPRYQTLRDLWGKLHHCLDGVALDQYTSPSTYGPGYQPADSESNSLREMMTEALSIVREHHPDKLMSIDEKGPNIVSSLPMNNPFAVSMANNVVRDYVILKSMPAIRHWLYYSWRRGPKNQYLDYGLWRDEAPRQTVAAYAAAARMLAHASFAAAPPTHRSVPCYIFRKNQKSLAVFWLSGKQKKATMILNPPSDAKFHDVQGNPILDASSRKNMEIPLTEAPVYLESNSSPETLADCFKKADFSLPELYAELNLKRLGEIEAVIRNLTSEKLTFTLSMEDFQKELTFAPNQISPVTIPTSVRHQADLNGHQFRITLKTHGGRHYAFENIFQTYGIKKVQSPESVRKSAVLFTLDNYQKHLCNVDFAANKLWTGPEDCSAEVRMGYDDRNLYLNILVRDEKHWNGFKGSGIWAGDAVQFAFDPLRNAREKKMKGINGFCEDDYLFTAALADNRPQLFCHTPADCNPKLKGEVTPPPEIIRNETAKTTEYRLTLPWTQLRPFTAADNQIFGFNLIILDSDREKEIAPYWMQLTPGIAGGQMPEKFPGFILEKTTLR